MSRWEPDAPGRLRAAALELFEELGYEQTSVSAIAERAGVTARTFFRYFVDKREVLFSGGERLEHLMVRAIASTPPQSPHIKAVGAALLEASEFFSEERRPYSRRRRAVVEANPELYERELIKLAGLSATLKSALRPRGVDELGLSLLSECGMAVFQIVFRQWATQGEKRTFKELTLEALERWHSMSGVS